MTRDLALRHALIRTQDPDDAEDVAQEVLILVLKSIGSFRFRSKFSSWVYRITENQIQSQVRSRASTEVKKSRVRVKAECPTVDSSPELAVDASRLWDAVTSVVDGLPKLQDRTFRLVAIQDWKPCEAAQALGKSQTNVRASLSRARVKIRERLLEKAPALVMDLGFSEPNRAA
ncbi:MAG: RNA polymerase sigma factor [Gemmatimonadetes bacterium]|nr:RNA polymerase sigma factor [Gemmatimonadota bacterium]